MIGKLSLAPLVLVAALSASVGAVPTGGGSGSQCNTGTAQCCQSTSSSGGLLIGLTCTSIPIIGGVPTCDQKPVCCNNVVNGGLIAIGCVPIVL